MNLQQKIQIILTTIFIAIPIWITYSSNNETWKNNIKNIHLIINNKKVEWINVHNSIDKIVTKKSSNDLSIKKDLYAKLILKVDTLKEKIWIVNTNNLVKILSYWYKKVIQDTDIFYSKTHEINLWFTKSWKKIIAYYKWNPEKWYFWVFANIHWWYEYWSYTSAVNLLDTFNKSWKSWRFIIPTINPEWLDYYLNSVENRAFYTKWRVNSNNVDLNRNFCTKNFELNTFVKNWEYFQTWIWWCNSEKETQIISKTLERFKFNQVVSLHSEWNIFYLPDDSIDDVKIRTFWNELHKLLPSFDFDVSYNNKNEREQKIYKYEVDEWWSKLFTWTMITYIYETYNIPAILIELKKHWETEYELENLVNFLK